MNENATDNSTPTGKALGNIALVAASALAVTGSAYMGTKMIGKGIRGAEKVASKVTGGKTRDAKRMLDEIDPYAEKGANKARAKEYVKNQKETEALKKVVDKEGGKETYNDLKSQYGIKRDGPSKWDDKIKEQAAQASSAKPPDVTQDMFADEVTKAQAYM